MAIRQWNARCRRRLRSHATLLRILRNPLLAFGETYMEGMWEPRDGDLATVLNLCAKFADTIRLPLVGAETLRRAMGWLGEVNSQRGARGNVHRHYDLDYSVFRRFLDQDVHYSCAYFRDESDSLEAAQQAKCEHLATKLQLRPGARVLDIGCGWGSLAMHLAERYKVHCVGITLSEEQLKVAQDRAERRGIARRLGERFCRMWEFYLLSCAAGFHYADLVVFQFQMTKSIDRLPLTRDYLYSNAGVREPLRAHAASGNQFVAGPASAMKLR